MCSTLRKASFPSLKWFVTRLIIMWLKRIFPSLSASCCLRRRPQTRRGSCRSPAWVSAEEAVWKFTFVTLNQLHTCAHAEHQILYLKCIAWSLHYPSWQRYESVYSACYRGNMNDRNKSLTISSFNKMKNAGETAPTVPPTSDVCLFSIWRKD